MDAAALRRTFIPNSHLYIPVALFLLAASCIVACITSVRRISGTFPRRKGGVEPSAVKSLPLVAYGEGAKQRMIDDCAICLSEFQRRERVKLIPYCGHVFHSVCIDTWLSSHVTCPLCRSSQLFNTNEAPP